MDLVKAVVLSNEEIMPGTHVLELGSAELARAAAPGQFLHIRTGPTWDPLLRRPMSIFRMGPDWLSLMVRSVGIGSDVIAHRQAGDELDCLGPLGKPFQVAATTRRLVMVGGGYGVAPLVGLAERVVRRGCEVVLLVGAASAAYVFPARRLPVEVEYEVATIDGSLGYRGVVTDMLPRYLDWADAVYACGPTGMLEAVARICRPSPTGRAGLFDPRKPVQLAMEQQMGCAMGVCLGCVVRTRKGYQRVCRDGPVFQASELVWGASD